MHARGTGGGTTARPGLHGGRRVTGVPTVAAATGLLGMSSHHEGAISSAMSATTLTVGFVYVLTNESMPGLVKVGLTSSLPEDRAQDLYTTSVAEAFNVAFRTTTSRPRAVERRAHDLLNEHRTNPKREFFRVSVGKAIEAVRRALVDAGGMDRGICSDVGRQGGSP